MNGRATAILVFSDFLIRSQYLSNSRSYIHKKEIEHVTASPCLRMLEPKHDGIRKRNIRGVLPVPEEGPDCSSIPATKSKIPTIRDSRHVAKVTYAGVLLTCFNR